jgi:tetratricopeptide (TPR) repeat protein
MTRIRESFFVDEAFVLTQLGRYSEADEIMVGPVQSSMRRATADPQDLRSLADVLFALDRQAGNLDIEADPALGASVGGRRRYLAAEEKSLVQERDGLERMVKLNPSQQEWKPVLGDAEVRLGSVQSILQDQTNAAELVRKGLATLRESIKEDPGSPEIFDTTAKDLLIAEPASLKNPQLAVSYAERAVALTHRKMPSRLLTLSQAYAAAGQTEKCRMTATDGLALLPDWQAGTSKSRLRKLLEIEARSGL